MGPLVEERDRLEAKVKLLRERTASAGDESAEEQVVVPQNFPSSFPFLFWLIIPLHNNTCHTMHSIHHKEYQIPGIPNGTKKSSFLNEVDFGFRCILGTPEGVSLISLGIFC